MSGAPPLPARGVVAGIRADLKKSKDAANNPNGTGTAWSHNFLNQKPWHPLNYRNQVKRWEAEQRHAADEREKEQAKREFEAESEYMKTLSYLSEAERQRYADRQSVAFMYTKPPGLDAALARDAAAAHKTPAGGTAAAAAGATGAEARGGEVASTSGAVDEGEVKGRRERPQKSEAEQAHNRDMDRIREDPFSAMLAARIASEKDTSLFLKHVAVDTGPAYGGFTRDAPNQQMLVSGAGAEELNSEVNALLALPEEERRRVVKALKKLQKQQAKEQELQNAVTVLQSAGYDLTALARESGVKDGKEKKKSEKSKKKRKSSKSKRRRRDDTSSSPNSSSSSESD